MAGQGRVEEEFLSCCICFEIFKEPKTLSCLHRFCERCLHNYILGLNGTDLSRLGGFNCPMCRDFIKSPSSTRPPSDWASLLKTDFHLKSLIRFVEARADFSPAPQHPCSVHGDEQCDIFCADCSLTVCHLCAAISHRGCNRVITLAEAAKDRRAVVSLWLNKASAMLKEASDLERSREKCLDGLERQRSAVEAAIRHRCGELQQLVQQAEEELVGELQRKYEALQDKVAVRVIRFDHDVDRFKKTLQHMSTRLSKASDYDLLTDSALTCVRDWAHGSDFDIKWYREFVANLSGVTLVFHKSAFPPVSVGEIVLTKKDEQDECSSSGPKAPMPPAKSQVLLSRASNLKGKTQRSLKDDVGTVDVSNTIKCANQPASQGTPRSCGQEAAETAAPVSGRSADRGSGHKYSPAISQAIDCPSIESGTPSLPSKSRTYTVLGCGSGQQWQQGQQQKKQQQRHQRWQQMQTSNPGHTENERRWTVVKLRSIDCRFREDEHSPRLRDLVVLGTTPVVVVTDWANQSVKALHVRRDLDRRLALGGKPWSITGLTDQLVAVSLPLSQQICVVKVFPSLVVQNSVVSAKRYTGLASLNSSILVATGGSQPICVDVINLYGEVLKSFSSDHTGAPLFAYPAYVSVTSSMLILVSDRKQGTVLCLSHTGEVKFRSEAEALHLPNGVTSDLSGRVFVVESGGLSTLSPHGCQERTLVTAQDGTVQDPRGIALDHSGLVYVTTNDHEVVVLKVD